MNNMAWAGWLVGLLATFYSAIITIFMIPLYKEVRGISKRVYLMEPDLSRAKKDIETLFQRTKVK